MFGFLNKKANKSATVEDARVYFDTLISNYAGEFSVNSKKQVLEAYRSISALNTVIKRSAKAFVTANIHLTDNNDKVIQGGNTNKIIETPNALQSKSEFFEAIYINYSLFGVSYVLKEMLAGFGINSLLCLPTVDTFAKIKNKPNYLRFSNINDIIDYYYVDFQNGRASEIDTSLIWELRQISLSIANDGYISNENPLSAVKKELALLSVIADVKQELIGNHGAKGIISPDTKGEAGAIPLTKKEKKQISKDYFESNGLIKGKDKLIISNKGVKFTSISLKIAELLLNEMQEKAELSIANNFSFPTSLLTTNATYENKDAGNKELYENKIIPESKIIADSFNLNIAEKNEFINFDYSEISFLQKDNKAESERKAIDTRIIIDLNKSIANGELSRDNAIYSLVLQGYSDEEAKKLISK